MVHINNICRPWQLVSWIYSTISNRHKSGIKNHLNIQLSIFKNFLKFWEESEYPSLMPHGIQLKSTFNGANGPVALYCIYCSRK